MVHLEQSTCHAISGPLSESGAPTHHQPLFAKLSTVQIALLHEQLRAAEAKGEAAVLPTPLSGEDAKTCAINF